MRVEVLCLPAHPYLPSFSCVRLNCHCRGVGAARGVRSQRARVGADPQVEDFAVQVSGADAVHGAYVFYSGRFSVRNDVLTLVLLGERLTTYQNNSFL